MSKVCVDLMENTDGSRFVRDNVYSDARDGIVAMKDVGDAGSEDRNGQLVQLAAASCTTHLCERGDELDPLEVSRAAREAYHEMMVDHRQSLN